MEKWKEVFWPYEKDVYIFIHMHTYIYMYIHMHTLVILSTHYTNSYLFRDKSLFMR